MSKCLFTHTKATYIGRDNEIQNCPRTYIFNIDQPFTSKMVTLEQSSAVKIEILKPALYPEDIKYNPKNGMFVVGSFREGAVYEVDIKGSAKLLVKDEQLISALGIQLDLKRNRLYVATANLDASIKTHNSVKKLAGLGIYKLDTGEKIKFLDLGASLPNKPHLANGITMDDEGNIYVTDSFSPTIYKVSPNLEASIFLQDDMFKGDGINLNGIAYHPDGYLILAKKSEGLLFKVPLDKPKNFKNIKLSRPIYGLDGVTFINNEEIVVVANRASGVDQNAAVALYSTDGWISAEITGVYDFGDVYPTTNVVRGRDIFGMYSRIGNLVAAPADEKATLNETAVIIKIGSVKASFQR